LEYIEINHVRILAQEHLDILKEVTTREIANDAMELSMRSKKILLLILSEKRWSNMDSVELLLYQNKQTAALEKIKSLKEGHAKELHI